MPRGHHRPAGAVAVTLLMLLPAAAAAHVPGEAGDYGLWNLDPWVLVPWTLVLLGYVRGLVRLWRRAGVGRGVAVWRALCFTAGMATTFIALIWPFEALGAFSFAAHMTQHMLLMSLAAPLLVLGRPLPVLLLALPLRLRRGAGRLGRRRALRACWHWLCRPAIATALHAVAVWAWHAPAMFELALRYDSVHILEHLSFLGTAMLFWWAVLLSGRDRATGYGGGAMWVILTLVHTGLLGAIITFAPRPLYPSYVGIELLGGMTALEDQQLAGLIMWIPGGVLYMIAGLVLMAAWLFAERRRPPPPKPAVS